MSQYFGTSFDDVNTITISYHKVNPMTTVLNTQLWTFVVIYPSTVSIKSVVSIYSRYIFLWSIF